MQFLQSLPGVPWHIGSPKLSRGLSKINLARTGWHAVALAEASDEEVRDGVAAVLQQFPAIPLGDGQPKRYGLPVGRLSTVSPILP